MRVIAIAILFLFTGFVGNAQSISDMSLSSDGSLLTVYFNLNAKNANERYNFDLELYKSPSIKIPVIFSGDVSNISGGRGKQIIIDLKSQNVSINENVFVKLKAHKVFHINKTSHLVKSALLPGLGDYRIYNGGHHIIYGVGFYGGIAGSVALNGLAYNSYQKYLSDNTVDGRNQLFNQSKQYRTLSYVSLGVSAGIWLYDMYRVNRRASQIDATNYATYSNYYKKSLSDTILAVSPVKWVDTRSPFEIAMDKGQKEFQNKNYEEASKEFRKALAENPNDTNAKKMLNDCLSELLNLQVLEKEYQAIILKGDSFMELNKYESAIEQYRKAEKLRPEADLYWSKIAPAEDLLKKQKDEQQYNKYIQIADNFFSQKKYKEAKEEYENALALKPNASYPKDKLKDIDSILNVAIYPINEWSDWEVLYKDSKIKVEISYKLSDKSCQNGKQNKYKYNVTSLGYLPTKYVNYVMDYKDCNGKVFYIKNSLKVGQGEATGSIESMDFQFVANSLIKPFYDVTLDDYQKYGTGEK